MRTGTKIKQALKLYDLHFSMFKDKEILVFMTHKVTDIKIEVSGYTLGQVATKLYKVLNEKS